MIVKIDTKESILYNETYLYFEFIITDKGGIIIKKFIKIFIIISLIFSYLWSIFHFRIYNISEDMLDGISKNYLEKHSTEKYKFKDVYVLNSSKFYVYESLNSISVFSYVKLPCFNSYAKDNRVININKNDEGSVLSQDHKYNNILVMSSENNLLKIGLISEKSHKIFYDIVRLIVLLLIGYGIDILFRDKDRRRGLSQ